MGLCISVCYALANLARSLGKQHTYQGDHERRLPVHGLLNDDSLQQVLTGSADDLIGRASKLCISAYQGVAVYDVVALAQMPPGTLRWLQEARVIHGRIGWFRPISIQSFETLSIWRRAGSAAPDRATLMPAPVYAPPFDAS
jgi:hypothetical protein